MYRKDEADIVDLDTQSLAGVEQDGKLAADLGSSPNACTGMIRFDPTIAPFDDAKVRLAMAKGLDRSGYVAAIGNRDQPATSLIPSGLPGHDAEDSGQSFDPDAARKLLAASGYGARAFPATVWPYQMPSQGMRIEWISAQWQRHLGLSITPLKVTRAEMDELRGDPARAPKITLGGWCADYPDQQNWLSIFHSSSVWYETPFDSTGHSSACGTAATRCISESFDRLVEEADAHLDQTRRDELYLQASRMLIVEAAGIWLSYTADHRLTKPWVRALGINGLDPGGRFNPADVYVVKH
jgi:oligopeptide transport system substrate-binding protein